MPDSPSEPGGGYDPAFGLFRAALVQTRAAQRLGRSRHTDRRIQEQDAAATAVILAQASLEAWIRSACDAVSISGKGKNWLRLWRDEPTEVGLRRGYLPGAQVSQPESALGYLEVMSHLRNYLVHGEAQARARLAKYFQRDPSHLLVWIVAEYAIDGADELFTYGMAVTGLLAPTRKRLLELHPRLLE